MPVSVGSVGDERVLLVRVDAGEGMVHVRVVGLISAHSQQQLLHRCVILHAPHTLAHSGGPLRSHRVSGIFMLVYNNPRAATIF